MSDEDEYDSWKKKNGGVGARISKNFSAWYIIIGGVIFFFLHSLVAKGIINTSVFLTAIIVIIALAIFLLFRKDKEPLLIPEHIIKQIVIEALRNKQRAGKEIPHDAIISVGLITGIKYKNDLGTGESGFVKRDVICYLSRKGYKQTIVVGVQPYDGTILDIRREPLGYTGRETKDVTIVPVSSINILGDSNEKR